MGLIQKIIERHKDRLAAKYEYLLLTDEIRLMDVPEWLRQDYRRCFSIYITAFRIDRGTSKERFEEDLLNLEVEITFAQAYQNPRLEQTLTRILKLKTQELEIFFPP